MKNRQRVISALTHKQPDCVPYDIHFTEGARKKMAEYYGNADFETTLGNCLTFFNCEPQNSWKEIKPDIFEDQFGVQWDRTVDKDIGVVCNRIITPDTLDDNIFPDAADASRYTAIEKAAAAKSDRFLVANLGFSLYERAWTLCGMENLMMAFIADPAFAHKLLDKILEFNLQIINRACFFDIDAMMFGDDWGMQTGLQMGPDLWREFIKPRIRQMYSAAKAQGKYVFIHSCGKVDELFNDLIECGLDVFNPFQPEVMDVYAMKRTYGDRLSFYGGISTQNTLPYGTVAQVKDEVQRLLDEIGRDGGYICSPAHAIPSDAKPENISAMIHALQNQ